MIAFIHVAKTAGSSLYSIFRSQYPPSALFKLGMAGPSLKSFFSLDQRRREGIEVVYGHVDMSLRDRLPASTRYITMLRDPLHRAVSYYWYVREMTDDSLHKSTLAIPFADWIEHQKIIELDNGMVRQLSGAMDAVPFGGCTREMLQTAISNLSRFHFVGLSERFEESYVMLSRLFEWRIRYCRREKQNLKKPPLNVFSAEEIAKVSRHHQLDQELYEFGKRLFEERIREANFQSELSVLWQRSADWKTRVQDKLLLRIHDCRRHLVKKLPRYQDFG